MACLRIGNTLGIVCLSVCIFRRKGRQFAWFAFAVVVAISSLFSTENRGPVDSERVHITLEPYYSVPKGYIHVSDTKIPKLGAGFIGAGSLTYLENEADRLGVSDPDVSYMNAHNLGILYLLNLKGGGTVELRETKGYERAQETIECARRTKSIVLADDENFERYYFYYWLLTSGEYEYNSEKNYFLPVSDDDKERVSASNKEYVANAIGGDLVFYSCPATWGNSMNFFKII